jgi:hypothetical protein
MIPSDPQVHLLSSKAANAFYPRLQETQSETREQWKAKFTQIAPHFFAGRFGFAGF